MTTRDMLLAVLGKLVTASPEALNPDYKDRVLLTIQRDQEFQLEWRIASRNGMPDTWIPVFRIGIQAEKDHNLAPNGFAVWWWHDNAYPLAFRCGWKPHHENRDHLHYDSDHYVARFRIMASVMEKLPELKRLLNTISPDRRRLK